MFAVSEPSSSITVVPRISAASRPPCKARKWQYELMAFSPPICWRKRIASAIVRYETQSLVSFEPLAKGPHGASIISNWHWLAH